MKLQSYNSYIILQELYLVKLHPYPLHSSAKGTWTLVYSIGHPHFLATTALARQTLPEPTMHVKKDVIVIMSFTAQATIN